MAHESHVLPQDGSAVRATLHAEDIGDDATLVIQHTQDCTPIVDGNARLRQHEQLGTPAMDARLAARVPEVVHYGTWATEFQAQHGVHPMVPDLRQVPQREHTAMRREIAKKWRRFRNRKLNDNAYAHFRVWRGRLPT